MRCIGDEASMGNHTFLMQDRQSGSSSGYGDPRKLGHGSFLSEAGANLASGLESESVPERDRILLVLA